METRRKIFKWGLLALAAAAAVATVWLLQRGVGDRLAAILADPAALKEWFARFGPYDEAVFVLIRAAQTCVKFIPAEPLEIGAGYLWGAGGGLLWCLLGNTIGSCVILLLMRLAGKRVTDRLLPAKAHVWLETIQRSDKLYLTLTVIYLIPGTPKDGLVYLAGLMKVDMRIYMLINILGRIPSILTSTLCGAAFGEKQYLLSAVIFVLSLLLALAGGWLVKRWQSKEKHLKSEEYQ